jgi:very-short-patch-repair endonuclease
VLAATLGRPEPEVQRLLDANHSRRLLGPIIEGLPAPSRAAFELFAPSNDTAAEDGTRRLNDLLALMAPRWPCLLVPGARATAGCLRHVAALISAHPPLPACIVLEDGDWEALQAQLAGTRLLGILREGLVRVRSSVPGLLGPEHRQSDAAAGPTGITFFDDDEAPADLSDIAAATRTLQDDDQPPDVLDRARSAIEAFLFQLLEQRSTTVGLFELNSLLEFKHGGQAAEADLLCQRWRVVVEVDGYHHFIHRECFRRDRRKDLLLQQHGYLVLRVLAEGVLPRMSEVLRSIEDALQWRRNQNGGYDELKSGS